MSAPAPSLAPGQVIAGRYRVVAHLGSGGMGDVYEVEHVLLNKRFALKRLSADIGDDKALVERFLREARAAAATGHPGVVDVVDVGFDEQERPYLVMERLVGETLRRRLDRGSLDVPMLLRVAHAILDALEAVHARAIIHRDIKPDNLFLCRDGRLKVLDFGLSHDTNVDVRLTQSGAVMGTPAYMAPEQARGGDVDLRTDLHAVGAVLYECAAGRAPFVAATYSVLIAMILEDEVEESPIAHLPERLRSVIMRALAKRADDRFESAAEMREALDPVDPSSGDDDAAGWGGAPSAADEELVSSPTLMSRQATPAPKKRTPPPAAATAIQRPRRTNPAAAPTPAPESPSAPAPAAPPIESSPPPPPRRRVSIVIIGAIAIVAIGAIAIWIATRRGGGAPSDTAPPLALTSSHRLTLEAGCEEYPQLTPDGRGVVYDGFIDGDDEILYVGVDGGGARRLTHDPGWDYAPALSPDGRRIAYVHEGADRRTVRVIEMKGGTPHELGPISGYPAWSLDGALLVGDASGRVLRWDLAADTAAGIVSERVLAQLPAGARPYHVAAIPGGGVAVMWWTSSEADRTALGEIDANGALRVIEEGATDYDGGLAASPTRRGYYATRKAATTGNELWWRPWGGGAPVLVPGGLSPRAGVAISADGHRLALSTCTESSYVAKIDAGAAPTAIARGDWKDGNPFAADPAHLVITSDRRGRQQGWLVDLATGDARAVTPLDSHGATPSPDGNSIAFAADGGRGGIAIVPTAGGATRRLTRDPSDSAPVFTRDGAQVAFVRIAAGGKPHVYVVPARGGAERMLAAGAEPAASPVDDTLAFVSAPDDTGAVQVLLGDLSGAAPHPVPALAPAAWAHPRFSADGKRLLLVRGYKELVVVTLDGSAPPSTFWTAGTSSILAADWSPDQHGVVAALADYDGDIWIADGTFP
ncbi:MAG TPA: protein kinase [Kofleriaceae bacterium]|nr:protein kinase [Kofleriaceae bacterium]